MPEPWFEDEIARSLQPLLPGIAVEVVSEIDSTNTELMRRSREGRGAAVLLVAERQTAGRGRSGRPWQSAQHAGEPASLTFSLGLSLAPRDWSGLSLAVGASVAESLDPTGAAGVMLKWPNDLWMHERKLVGILIETALLQPDASERYLVIGVGINVGPREAAGLNTPPAWLKEWRPTVTPGDVLREIAAPLLRDVLRFSDSGFVPFASRFAARDVLRGRDVRLSDGTEGHCEGVGWGGELLVRTAAGVQLISSSEVSVRPRSAPR